MDNFLFSYVIISVLSVFFMIFLIFRMLKSRTENKFRLVSPMLVGTVAIIFYSAFLISSYYKPALIFTELFYCCTDWLAFFMFDFSIAYTKKIKFKRKFDVIFIILASIDTISLLVNTVTHHSFDISIFFYANSQAYWGVIFEPLHYVHLSICYFMVVMTFVILGINSFSAPHLYRRRYISVLILYFAVIISNFISYTFNTPVDFSVIFYGILAFLITYYSNNNFPTYLINSSLHDLNESLSDAIVHFDYEGKVIYMNPAAKKFFDKLSGVIKENPEEFRVQYIKNPCKQLELENDEAFEKSYYKIEYKNLIFENSLVGSYIRIEDKTEEENRIRRERFAATHDRLTGFYNRRGFFEAARTALQNNVYKNPILLCSNIKNFKFVNEIFDDVIGDEILTKQAAMMEKFGHSTNINGRFNDDRFLLLMEKEYFDKQVFIDGFHALEKVIENSTYRLSINIGIYEITSFDEDVQIMCDKAKMAMDTIADDYKTMFAYYDSNLMDKILIEKNIVSEFETAFENNQIEPYLFPIMTPRGEIKCVELLSRWNNPKLGKIKTSVFIKILEKTDLIYRLDRFMFEKAFQIAADWEKKGIKFNKISVNLSQKTMEFLDVYELLKKFAMQYNVSPGKIAIEVKEDALVSDYEAGKTLFKKIKNEGFLIVIDSFGSDYSSLNVLKDFNLDAIKIDAEFFRDIETYERSRIILDTILALARDLKMNVIAKGIETQEQKKHLIDLGLNLLQGFYISEPVPRATFEKEFF